MLNTERVNSPSYSPANQVAASTNTTATTVGKSNTAAAAAAFVATIDDITAEVNNFLDLADEASGLNQSQAPTEDKLMVLTKLKKSMATIVDKAKKALPTDIANVVEQEIENTAAKSQELSVLKQNCTAEVGSIMNQLKILTNVAVEKYTASLNNKSGGLGGERSYQSSTSNNNTVSNTVSDMFSNLSMMALIGTIFDDIATSTKASAEFQIKLSHQGQTVGQLASDFMGLLNNVNAMLMDLKTQYQGTAGGATATEWSIVGFSINSHVGGLSRNAAQDLLAGVFSCYEGPLSSTWNSGPPPDSADMIGSVMPNATVAAAMLSAYNANPTAFNLGNYASGQVPGTGIEGLITDLGNGGPNTDYAEGIVGLAANDGLATPLFDSGNGATPPLATTSGIWIPNLPADMAKMLGGITVSGYTLVTKNLLNNACLAVSEKLHAFNANYPGAVGEGSASDVNGTQGTLYTGLVGLSGINTSTLPNFLSETVAPIATNISSQISNLEQHVSTLLGQIMEFIQQVGLPEVQNYQKCSDSIPRS